MTLIFRAAVTSEAEAVQSLVRSAYALYISRLDHEPAPMLADYADLIEKDHVQVAEEEGLMLGILVSYPRGSHLHVENIAVAPDGQGRGIGRALMVRAEEQAREIGLDIIKLYTNEVMQENFSFYAALGYEITGRAVEEGYNRVFFRKDITAFKA